MMVLVAIVALLLGRSMNFWNRERGHRREAAIIGDGVEVYLLLTPAGPGGLMHPDSGHPIVPAAAPIRAYVKYQREMAEKYESAFRHPWRWVEADPPAPPKPSSTEVERYLALLDDL
jgi:hypothetical protein